VHESGHGRHDPEDLEALEAEEREVTVALMRYRTPLAAVTLPRLVNSDTAMQAAAPAMEITRLLRLLGVGADVLRAFGAVLLVTAALSVFIALWNAVRERRADLAMLRMLGAPPGRVAGCCCARRCGWRCWPRHWACWLGHGLTAVAGWFLQADKSVVVDGWQWVPLEAWVPVAAVGVALLAALLPAISAYRVDVARLLNTR
jgi:putative ABC transport system permease protein